MPYDHIEIERTGHVSTIWLNRPEKLNALSGDMWSDIPTAVEEINADEAARVIILAARGEAFTVGIDVGMLATMAMDGPSKAAANMHLYETIKTLQLTASVFADSPKPVVASIHGFCLGAGMDLITACDVRVASSDAIFSIRETKMALVADIGTLQRLPSIVGNGHAAELAMTGADFDAVRAMQIGLVSQVHSDADSTYKAAHTLASEIAANSPLVVQGIKKVLAANNGRTVDEALEFVAQWNSSFLLSNDLMEAINAYFEKRPPEFTGH
ncbi:MAG: crotonase/enoyl-CoA hydratase family protein [Acidimicrobiia bacterium]|nr:crotonase/enoyl-CoA hydratase family protein [Acidimicrobiia bacterium]MDH3462363.1 crotonase/enoyl-CoA hydratase family protein [Acidimicrobiia bacterium]